MRTDIYTADERARRDGTLWTPVQGVLAAVQFVVFAISLGLVIRFLMTGDGYTAATVSVVIKTAILLAIMTTGAIWEKVVFGQYLFAPVFFWEDAVSMIVIALHIGYVAALILDLGTAQDQMIIALAAYATYVINAGQFLRKFRLARQVGTERGTEKSRSASPSGAANAASSSSAARIDRQVRPAGGLAGLS